MLAERPYQTRKGQGCTTLKGRESWVRYNTTDLLFIRDSPGGCEFLSISGFTQELRLQSQGLLVSKDEYAKLMVERQARSN